jgi:hypothetical protein
LDAHEAADHHDLVAELGDGVVQLLDRLLRRVHRDDRGRDDPVGQRAELVHREHVVGPADGAPLPRVLHAVEAEPGRRVHHAEVDAEVVQALVHEPREHGGRPVEHVLAGRGPERFHADPLAGALGHRHLERVRHALGGRRQPLDCRVTADAPELLAHDRRVLDPVAVGVDDRMTQAGVKGPGVHMAVALHVGASDEQVHSVGE